MKKLIIFAAVLLLSACSTTKDLVDYDLFKNELNSAIVDSGFDTDYRIK